MFTTLPEIYNSVALKSLYSKDWDQVKTIFFFNYHSSLRVTGKLQLRLFDRLPFKNVSTQSLAFQVANPLS